MAIMSLVLSCVVGLALFLVLTALADGPLRFHLYDRLKAVYVRIQRLMVQ